MAIISGPSVRQSVTYQHVALNGRGATDIDFLIA